MASERGQSDPVGEFEPESEGEGGVREVAECVVDMYMAGVETSGGCDAGPSLEASSYCLNGDTVDPKCQPYPADPSLRLTCVTSPARCQPISF
jgi:hypothetical protein